MNKIIEIKKNNENENEESPLDKLKNIQKLIKKESALKEFFKNNSK